MSVQSAPLLRNYPQSYRVVADKYTAKRCEFAPQKRPFATDSSRLEAASFCRTASRPPPRVRSTNVGVCAAAPPYDPQDSQLDLQRRPQAPERDIIDLVPVPNQPISVSVSARWKPKTLVRSKLLPTSAQPESVQDYLAMALWYDKRYVIYSCDPTDATQFHSMYQTLCQLEKEGFLLLDWQQRTDADNGHLIELKQMALTTAGQRLLAELQAKSPVGKLKERLVTIGWAAASAVVTTLAVMAFKS